MTTYNLALIRSEEACSIRQSRLSRFDAISFQTDDLKWLVPMVVGAIALLSCAIALLRGNKSLACIIIAVISAALVGASVFAKVAYSKDGLIIETVQSSAKSLADLQEVVDSNTSAIDTLAKRINDVVQASQSLPSEKFDLKYWKGIAGSTKQVSKSSQLTKSMLDDIKRNNDNIFDTLKRLGPIRN